MKRLQSIAREISRAGAIVGGALLLIAVDHDLHRHRAALCVVAGRSAARTSLSGYALAIASAWGFSAALLSRSHIRIDTVYVRVRRPRPRRARPA